MKLGIKTFADGTLVCTVTHEPLLIVQVGKFVEHLELKGFTPQPRTDVHSQQGQWNPVMSYILDCTDAEAAFVIALELQVKAHELTDDLEIDVVTSSKPRPRPTQPVATTRSSVPA